MNRIQKRTDTISNLVRSPFNIYCSHFGRYYDLYSSPLIDDIEKIKTDSISISLLSIHMYELKNLYELFRPESIKHDDPYWGTVSVIDNIFYTLDRYFNLGLNYRFTKYGQTMVEQIFRELPIKEQIDWDYLKTDLKYILEAIDIKIAEKAILSKEYFLKFYEHIYPKLISNLIKIKFGKNKFRLLGISKIEPGTIFLNDDFLEFEDPDELYSLLYNKFASIEK